MSITRYFRKALAVQTSPRIAFKNENFFTVSPKAAETGLLPPEIAGKLREQMGKENKDRDMPLPILIAARTAAAEYAETIKTATSTDVLTCVFFVPAMLLENGVLQHTPEKMPWFVREFLSPMVEPELSVGNETDVDAFLSGHTAEWEQIESWEAYWAYAKSMYEAVTHSAWDAEKIGNLENVKADGNFYVFADTTVMASTHILRLYDDLLQKEKTEKLPLYRNFVSTAPASARPMQEITLSAMKNHGGQMGGAYPLSPSQRESLQHLQLIRDGEILAVSGPPGTGKTTLLQSVVADMLVRHALEEKEAPVIAASSTNNQAVTNIIDSFSHVPCMGLGNLEKRWVTAADGFAVYFPSAGKEGEAKQKRYPIGKDVSEGMNKAENIEASRVRMLEECREYFGEEMQEISLCRQRLHQKLSAIEMLKNQLLEGVHTLWEKTKGKTAAEYIADQREEQEAHKAAQIQVMQTIADKEAQCGRFRERMCTWKKEYRRLPWYIRVFSFIPACRKAVIHWIKRFENEYEIEVFASEDTLRTILCRYQTLTETLGNEIYTCRQEKLALQKKTDACENRIRGVEKLLADCREMAAQLGAHGAVLAGEDTLQAFLGGCTPEMLNEKLDTSVRYVSFWLAVHFYECMWLENEPLTEKQLGTTIDGVVRRKLKRLAMLSPCMVMTFFMLPAQFRVWNANDRKNYYLYNFIDLLIVDEAGQTSPEIAAASFALAKRAIVVGDEQQIPPVWGTKRALDIAMAMQCGVIGSPAEFSLLEESGLNASESSVMRVAALSCPYHKYDRGLFLCEHRRCYDEIIDYCNVLVYGNRLRPCRGEGNTDEKRPLCPEKYPVIGQYDIRTEHSEKEGTSRINRREAERIAAWLSAHFDTICAAYASVPRADVLAVITPFKAQAAVIRGELNRQLGKKAEDIAVGTVHTFQGGERRVILFSTTYGASDGCYFIDQNKNLMNVAVSRAKDAFWVFGSLSCLCGRGEASASGLLAAFVKNHPVTPE